MGYTAAAWEKAMDVQAVILKALSGEIHWFRAADILGMHPRSLRRWRERYEQHGYHGLIDKRHQRPSQRRVPFAEVARLVRLYREQYVGFNVRHFHEIGRREHGIARSYRYVTQALQTAGLVKTRRPRGRHRRRREPRACFGELLHLDGSTPPWLALVPDQRPCLIAVPDDATNRVLHAALYPSESPHAVMTALRDVFRTYGLPMAMYTDRASWAFYTPTAKARWTSSGSRTSAAPSIAGGSSTFRRIRRRRAGAASGSIAPSKIGSSTSGAWRRSRRSRRPMPT